MSEPSYHSPPEAARLLRVDPSTVIGWIRAGELRASNLASRSATRPRYRISSEAIREFLAAREVAPRRKAIRRKPADKGVIQFF